jgi:hypothetical protein
MQWTHLIDPYLHMSSTLISYTLDNLYILLFNGLNF